MAGIIGDICRDEKALRRVAAKRRKEYLGESVEHVQVATYESNGWEILRRGKTKTRMKKLKPPDILFEDRVWMIFYKLQFWHMNKDRNCKLKLNGYTRQIDVLARDNDNIFVVECRSSELEQTINARSALEDLVGKREDIQKALESEWGRRCGRINLLIAVSSQEKREKDGEYVREKKDKNVLLWSARDIGYIEELIRQIGPAAKYQLYSVIFTGKKQKALKKKYVALRSKIGGRIIYSFLISSKELLRYAYVHHRKLTGIVETSQAYQRMLRSAKLKEIARFIDVEDGYFPNSIIVNFSNPLNWNKKYDMADVGVGTVTLPEYYGSAWIVDGQHRLYGVARAKGDIVVPVLAFEGMEQKEQASLFVEINEKQKKVPSDLLWDLFSDIYCDSSDEKQNFMYQVTETAKHMESCGPLKGYIEIPSIPADRPIKLSFTTVCSTIQKYSPWDHLKHQKDDTKTPENAARIINSYFSVIRSLWPGDWEKGNNGVLITNNGFGVFMMVFQEIINHLIYKQKRGLLQAHKNEDFEEELRKTYLTSVIEYLKKDENMQKQIKRSTGRGPQSYCAAILDLKIQEFVPDYSPARIGGIETIPEPKEPPAISFVIEKIRRAESLLRDFILEKLKRHYGGSKWWKQGIPAEAKHSADKRWDSEAVRKPHLRKEKEPNETKFGFFGLGEMVKIVFYGQNWQQVFETVFHGKSEFEVRIRHIKALRDPSSHERKIDDQDIIDGIGGLLWLSRCIGAEDLNPYV